MPTLKDDGDRYEKRFGQYVLQAFPHYEAFWAEFIVPMRGPDGIHLRPDIDPILLGLAEAHYSVFWHLMTVHHLIERQAKSLDEMILFFDAVLFHLSAATEMGERVLFYLALVEEKLTGKLPAGLAPLSEQKIVELAQGYVESKEYQKQLDKLRNRAQTVALPLHPREDVYKPSLVSAKASEAFAKFMAIAGGAREYRNRVAHNPTLFKVIENDRPYAPTRKHLSKCASWAAALESTQADDFAPIDAIEEEFINAIERALDGLWLALLPHLQTLSKDPIYIVMLGDSCLESAIIASSFAGMVSGSASGIGDDMSKLLGETSGSSLNSVSFPL